MSKVGTVNVSMLGDNTSLVGIFLAKNDGSKMQILFDKPMEVEQDASPHELLQEYLLSIGNAFYDTYEDYISEHFLIGSDDEKQEWMEEKKKLETIESFFGLSALEIMQSLPPIPDVVAE